MKSSFITSVGKNFQPNSGSITQYLSPHFHSVGQASERRTEKARDFRRGNTSNTFTNYSNECAQIFQMPLKHFVDVFVSHRPVHMHQHVAKTGHTLESLAQLGRNHFRFGQHCKTCSLFFRYPMQSAHANVKVWQPASDRRQCHAPLDPVEMSVCSCSSRSSDCRISWALSNEIIVQFHDCIASRSARSRNGLLSRYRVTTRTAQSAHLSSSRQNSNLPRST